MVIPLSLSSIGCGELGRVLETCYESCSCRLLVYVLWMSLRLHGFTSLRCCEWIGYRFDIIFCSGSFLVYMWQVLLLRLVIAGCRLDMLMMWDSLGIPLEVWIVGWVWHLLCMLFQLWIYFDNYRYMWLPLDQVFFCAWHFSWYKILWSSNATGWVAFSLDGFYVCPVVVA